MLLELTILKTCLATRRTVRKGQLWTRKYVLPFQPFRQLFWRWQVGVNNLVENGRVLFDFVLFAIRFAQHLLGDRIAIPEEI